MSYRYMRVVVFFDLPVLTEANRRDYRLFRKFLIKSGFMMVQESVYCKLAQNNSVGDAIIDNIRKINLAKDWFRYYVSRRNNIIKWILS